MAGFDEGRIARTAVVDRALTLSSNGDGLINPSHFWRNVADLDAYMRDGKITKRYEARGGVTVACGRLA